MKLENTVLVITQKSRISNIEEGDMKDCSIFRIFVSMPDKHKLFKSIFLHFIIKFLRLVADILYGIESGYKKCCITAYITNRRYFRKRADHVLCYKCYMKYNKVIKK